MLMSSASPGHWSCISIIRPNQAQQQRREGGGLQRLAGGLARHPLRSQPTQFLVNERQQFLGSLGIALLDAVEDLRDGTLRGNSVRLNRAAGECTNHLTGWLEDAIRAKAIRRDSRSPSILRLPLLMNFCAVWVRCCASGWTTYSPPTRT